MPIRSPCPPGACKCDRERLLALDGADVRILRLTRQEEKRLLERLENIASVEDLQRLQTRMFDQLGIRLDIAPGFNEVRSMRGMVIDIAELPGMCRKTRAAIPAAIRRGLEKTPEIAWRLLDAHDLFRDA
uniref:Ribosomal protein S3AE n=1 Tax=Pseudomonas graminis TaxID=158627 RepID=A0A7C2BG24_9PSED